MADVIAISDDEEWWQLSSQTVAEAEDMASLRLGPAPPPVAAHLPPVAAHPPPVTADPPPVAADPPPVTFRLGLLERFPPLAATGKQHITVPSVAPGIDESRKRHLLSVSGIEVSFPDPKPTSSQILMAERLVESFQSQKHAIIESPHGTCKSVSYLCAAFAYQRHCYLNNVPPPRILVAARNTSRLKHLAAKLRTTPYTPRVVTLASKSEMCSNASVRSNPSVEDSCRQACRLQMDNTYSGCERFANLANTTNLDTIQARWEGSDSVLDIEDIGSLGDDSKSCPFYLSRSLALVAHAVFLPFSLLLDQKGIFLSDHGSILDNAIVIFDGAHNLPDFAKEHSSSTISFDALNKIITACDAYRHHCGSPSSDTDLNVSVIRMMASQLRALVLRYSKEATDETFDEQGVEYLTWRSFKPHSQLGCMSRKRCNEILQSLANTEATSRFIEFSSDIIKSFRRVIQSILLLLERASSYYIQIRRKSEASDSGETLLSFDCIHPGILLKRLQKPTCSCVFISESLSPIRLFISQLGEDFRSRLSPFLHIHPVSDLSSQLLLGALHKVHPDSQPLNGGHRTLQRNFASYADEIGSAIVELARVITHGMIILVQSFKLLDHLSAHWLRNSTIESLAQGRRRVFFDTSEYDSDFRVDMVSNFASAMQGPPGAVLFTTYRSNILEQIESRHIRCQLCVCVGIPYPPTRDLVMQATIQHLDDIGAPDIAGVSWSTLYAMQIVNLSLARLYSSKNKLGMLLLDERYENPRELSCLPEWLRKQMKPFISSNVLVDELRLFFASKPPSPLESVEVAPTAVEDPLVSTEEDPSALAEYHKYVLNLCKQVLAKNSSPTNGTRRIPVPDDLEVSRSPSPEPIRRRRRNRAPWDDSPEPDYRRNRRRSRYRNRSWRRLD